MQPSVQALFFPHTAPALPDGVEVTRYRNAGLPKIDDAAMLWILFGFVEMPWAALRLAFWFWRQGYGLHPRTAWRKVYARQLQVWGWL